MSHADHLPAVSHGQFNFGRKPGFFRKLARIWRNYSEKQRLAALEDLSPEILADIGLDATDVICARQTWREQSPLDSLNEARRFRIRQNGS